MSIIKNITGNGQQSGSKREEHLIRSSKKMKGPNSIRNTYHLDINEKLLHRTQDCERIFRPETTTLQFVLPHCRSTE